MPKSRSYGLYFPQWKVLSPKVACRVKVDKIMLSLRCKHAQECWKCVSLNKTLISTLLQQQALLISTSLSISGRVLQTHQSISCRAKVWLRSSWVRFKHWAILGKISLHDHRPGACKSIPLHCCWSTSARRRPPRQRATGVGGQSSFLVTCGDSAKP